MVLSSWHGRCRAIVVIGALVVAVAAQLALASPAGAATFPNEQAMVDTENSDFRRTFVIDPGRGNRLSRAQIIDKAYVYLAPRGGFTRNFLWYSYEGSYVADADRRWSYCTVPPGNGGGTCPLASIGLNGRVGDTFGGDVALPSFHFGDDFIARACGNYDTDSDKDKPVPRIVGEKFHDLNRNGIMDGGEPGIAGWRFRIVQVTSSFGDETPGGSWDVVTDANGDFRFDLDEHGPGDYTVEEYPQPGWTETTGPGPRQVTVREGIGDGTVRAGAWGNVENEADVAKLSMTVVDPPAETTVFTDTPLAVRSVVTNRGPAGPVDVDETLVASGPADCTIVPPIQTVRLTLGRGETQTIDRTVVVNCSQPSFHTFVFDNRLSVITPGVTDVRPENNTASASVTVPVIAYADLEVGEVSLRCPDRADRNVAFLCTLDGEVRNAGPFGPVEGTPTLTLSGPADCVITPQAALPTSTGAIPSGSAVVVSGTWGVTCGQRSFHPLTAALGVEPTDEHVRDADPTDDSAETAVTVAVFEKGDLAVGNGVLLCDEVWTGDPFTCTLTVEVANAGPADAVQAEVAISLGRSDVCSVSPDRQLTTPVTLATGERRLLRYDWTVTCPVDLFVHDFRATVVVEPVEPHVEDLTQVDNRHVVHWQPADLKPASDPNTLNLRREGVVSVAILGTIGFDPLSEIDASTLRYGVTGTETSLIRCATEPEDVNGDGLGDMTCKFDVSVAGFTPGEQLGIVTGVLWDGTSFLSADRVRVIMP